MLHYTLAVSEPHAHLFDVELLIPEPDPAGQRLALPVWIPGSYLIREFARHVVSIAAYSGEAKVALVKLDKHQWQAAVLPEGHALRVVYRVYAYDLSVRGAYLDQFRGFFNGTSVFLAAVGQESNPCRLDVVLPDVFSSWNVATGLPRLAGEAQSFVAENYDVLIDHPFELGKHTQLSFMAAGIPHHVILAGRHTVDAPRLLADMRRICEYQIDFWGGSAPFADYHFLVMATGSGYGGLEHRNSTALLCSRDDLPQPHETGRKAAYRQFLGLVSHEYFHSWLVKRIKPQEFLPYDLGRENYTRQLWLFEGVTSYYDDVLLLRSGLLTIDEYLEQLAQTITAVARNPGSSRQTLEEASLDAWVKYYRQDENSPNALVSYYTKGALVALCTDLMIRRHSLGRHSLDDVLHSLWRDYGRIGIGVPDGVFEQLSSHYANHDLGEFFNRALRDTVELPLLALLDEIGIDHQWRVGNGARDKGGWLDASLPAAPSCGIRATAEAGGLRVTHVLTGSVAERAGLAADDLLLAIDGIRIKPDQWQEQLRSCSMPEKVRIHAFRRDELFEIEMAIGSEPATVLGLKLRAASSVPAIFAPA